MIKCEGRFREGVSAQNFMRLGWTSEWKDCENPATVEVEVTEGKPKEKGKMKLCDKCLDAFTKWATLKFTVRRLRK